MQLDGNDLVKDVMYYVDFDIKPRAIFAVFHHSYIEEVRQAKIDKSDILVNLYRDQLDAYDGLNDACGDWIKAYRKIVIKNL